MKLLDKIKRLNPFTPHSLNPRISVKDVDLVGAILPLIHGDKYDLEYIEILSEEEEHFAIYVKRRKK